MMGTVIEAPAKYRIYGKRQEWWAYCVSLVAIVTRFNGLWAPTWETGFVLGRLGLLLSHDIRRNAAKQQSSLRLL